MRGTPPFRSGPKRPPPPTTLPAAPEPKIADLPARPEREGSWFDLILGCPNCGGPIDASPYDVTRTCAHCRSLLLVKGEAADVWIQRPMIREAPEVAKLMIDQAIEAFEIEKRAEAEADGRLTVEDKLRIGVYAAEGGPAAILVVSALLLAHEVYGHLTPELADGSPNPHQSVGSFRRLVTERTRVLNLRRIMVPFALKDGATGRIELDRGDDHERRLRVFTVRLQSARAAYPEGGGLGDLSLQMSRASLVRPHDCDLSTFGWIPTGRRIDPPIADPTLERSASATFDRTTRDVGVCVRWEATVYRPYILAKVRVGHKTQLVLFDAVTGMLAGRPTEDDAGKVRRSTVSRAPAPKQQTLRILKSRCPNCGSDLELDPRDIIVVCANCREGVEPGSSGLSRSPLDVSPSPSNGRAVYLPFWRVPFSLETEGRTWTDLRTWSARLRAAGLPEDFRLNAPWLLIPAMPWLNSVDGDRAFVRTAQSLHRDPPEFERSRLPERQTPKFFPVRISSGAAKGLARSVLGSMIDEKAVVRLKMATLDKFLLKASLALGEARLSYVGFDSTRGRIRRGALEIPARVLAAEE